jgi:UMP kinase
LTYDEVLANPDIGVMDKAAIGLAAEEKKPMIICDLLSDGNIVRAARGEAVGTRLVV